MKQVLLGLVSLLFILLNPVYATAKLYVKVTGQVKNTDYICVTHVGCVNLAASAKGIAFPIHTGEIQSITLVNSKTFRMYPQKLPLSCKISVNDDKKVTVSGKVVASNDNVILSKLHCTIG